MDLLQCLKENENIKVPSFLVPMILGGKGIFRCGRFMTDPTPSSGKGLAWISP